MPEPTIGAGRYKVADGESVPTVALRSGHFWETLWNHPDNAALAALRKDATILVPGDEIVVPPIEVKRTAAATGKRHVFRRRGVPSRFSVQILDRDEPRANAKYRLEIHGRPAIEGALDANGTLDVFVDATVTSATLVIGDEIYEIEIGRLRPIDALDGIQQRLKNLGYYHGDVDGQPGAATTEAIRVFQAAAELPVTGEMDDTTRDALSTAHDQR